MSSRVPGGKRTPGWRPLTYTTAAARWLQSCRELCRHCLHLHRSGIAPFDFAFISGAQNMKTVGPDSSSPPPCAPVSFAHFVSSLVHLLLTFVLLYLRFRPSCSGRKVLLAFRASLKEICHIEITVPVFVSTQRWLDQSEMHALKNSGSNMYRPLSPPESSAVWLNTVFNSHSKQRSFRCKH
jgi:hypothetical protein